MKLLTSILNRDKIRMPLNFHSKCMIVAEISEIAKNALSAVVADFRGVVVVKMTELRKTGRETGVCIRILRNTLLRRVVKNTNFECLTSSFIGPTMIAFSMKHPGTAASLLKKFAKANETFKIKAAAFEGELIPATQIDRLANLPKHEEAIVRLIAFLKEISIGKLHFILTNICNVKNT